MSGNNLRYECLSSKDDVTFLPVGDQRQNIETRHPSSILGDSMDLKTTGPETGDRSGSQANDLKEEEGADEKPLACGTNNNQLLPPDGFDQASRLGRAKIQRPTTLTTMSSSSLLCHPRTLELERRASVPSVTKWFPPLI